MRRVVLLSLALSVALFAGCGGTREVTKGAHVGDLPWRLVEVSADARTLKMAHDAPHCETEPGAPIVREDASSVTVRIPEIDARFDPSEGLVCTAVGLSGTSLVKLRDPLGSRQLRGSPSGREPQFAQPVSKNTTCRQIRALPAHAPAREVPWVARNVRMCSEALPVEARAMPVLRRPRTAADELPTQPPVWQYLESGRDLLRTDLSRRLDPAAKVWWVPGPKRSCVIRVRGEQVEITGCAATQTVGQRGVFTPATCTLRPTRSIWLLGAAPAGVERVRLASSKGRGVTATVRRGVWSGRSTLPLEVRYAGVQTRVPDGPRPCYAPPFIGDRD